MATYTADQLAEYPDFEDGEMLGAYRKRTGITNPNVIQAKYAEYLNEQRILHPPPPPDEPDDAFVQYMTSKGFMDANNTEIAKSVAGLALSYIDKASDVLSPILEAIPGAGDAFDLAKQGLDALSATWGIDPDQSNDGIAGRIVYQTEVARYSALAIEDQMKKTLSPALFQAFIDSFNGKHVYGQGLKKTRHFRLIR
jgi:hypothetical protein